jgi:hypothetical protein
MENTMDNAPRRGRPPLDRANKDPMANELAPSETTGRRRRGKVGGHALKLSAPTREGFVRRWVNDDNMRIAQADDLAYDFVTDASAQSSDVGSRISRQVGTKANGEPLRAYLMETPVSEYQAGLAEKEAVSSQIDDAMTAIVDEKGQRVPGSEQIGQVSIKRDS